jgi:hypothetical protein
LNGLLSLFVLVQVDVNKLPKPAETCDAASYVAPRNQREQVLQGVWQEVLGLSQPPSVEADFFTELGGSSLQVLQQLWQSHPDCDSMGSIYSLQVHKFLLGLFIQAVCLQLL